MRMREGRRSLSATDGRRRLAGRFSGDNGGRGREQKEKKKFVFLMFSLDLLVL